MNCAMTAVGCLPMRISALTGVRKATKSQAAENAKHTAIPLPIETEYAL